MMKCLIFCGFALLFFFAVPLSETHASNSNGEAVSAQLKHRDDNLEHSITSHCMAELKKQIRKEFYAARQYLNLAAHFAQDSVNRPGFAKEFFAAASEEREHGIMLLEYLLMRRNTNLTTYQEIITTADTYKDPANGLRALKTALELEIEVTDQVRTLIKTCEEDTEQDYHLSDYLTGEFLKEQYDSIRQISGRIETLKKMMSKETNNDVLTEDNVHLNERESLGEFLFDKMLLRGEV